MDGWDLTFCKGYISICRWLPAEWSTGEAMKSLEEAAALAKMTAPHFIAALERSHWQVKTLKLSTRERNGFTLITA